MLEGIVQAHRLTICGFALGRVVMMRAATGGLPWV